MNTYSHLEMEAALCIWEHLDACSDQPRLYPDIYNYRQLNGTAEFRHTAITLARYCTDVYDQLPAKLVDDIAYDWDVIPTILDSIDWRTMPRLPIVAHGVSHTKAALKKLQAERTPKPVPKDRVPLCAGDPVMPPDKQPSRALPYAVFQRRFKPILVNGDIRREKLPRDPVEVHWWSVFPTDTHRWHIMPGIEPGHAAFFIKCRVPRGGDNAKHPVYAY